MRKCVMVKMNPTEIEESDLGVRLEYEQGWKAPEGRGRSAWIKWLISNRVKLLKRKQVRHMVLSAGTEGATDGE